MRIPDEISRVEGCTCSGRLYHRASEPRCELLDIQDEAVVEQALDKAEARIQAWVDERNRTLWRERMGDAGRQP